MCVRGGWGGVVGSHVYFSGKGESSPMDGDGESGGIKGEASCVISFGFRVAWKNDTNSMPINPDLIQSGLGLK